MAKWIDFNAVRGDTLKRSFSFKNGADSSNYDLTGYKSIFTLKKFIDDSENDEDAVFQLIQETIANPTLGVVYVQIEGTTTRGFEGKYYFDHAIIDKATGFKLTSWMGSIDFIRNVTRIEV